MVTFPVFQASWFQRLSCSKEDKCKSSLVNMTIACENIHFSALFNAGTFHVDEHLRLSDRNSILMMQINVYIINPVVMGFQI